MLEEQKKIVENNEYLNLRKNRRLKTSYEKSKNSLFFLSVIIGIIVVTGLYFYLDISNIFTISVRNNHYLSRNEIIELSGLSTNKKFLLTVPSKVEEKILDNPFIKECKVKLLEYGVVEINVEERKIIGYYSTNENSYFICDDNTNIEMNEDNISVISMVPLITGFSEEEMILIEKNFAECDYRIINEISEIHNYKDLKFQNVELVMRDGNYIFTSVYGLNILNKYYDIESSYLSNENSCYYFEDISGNAYTTACPWVKTEEENKDKKEDNTDHYDEDYDEDDE